MMKKRYRVKCLSCKGSNIAVITEAGNEYTIDLDSDHRHNKPYIISARYRGDMNFGWQCICGNNSLVARQEFPKIHELVINGSMDAIRQLTDSLRYEDNQKFVMTVI